MVSALNRKLLRELSQLRGQLITIALVVASGVAAFITTRSTLTSLHDARARFYTSSRFADVFAHLRRAPEAAKGRIEAIDGVSVVDTRIVGTGAMPMPSMTEPARATVVSLPLQLNTLHLRSGRMPEPSRDDEVVVSDAFADAHNLSPGDSVPLVLGGIRRELRVVGVGLSPEYVMVLNPADFAMDARKAAVLFMNRESVAAALDLEGSFNDVALRITPGVDSLAIVDRVDAVLEPYGGLGAVERDRQTSHYFLEQELAQLGAMSSQVPPLFLFVAAFLLHVVLSRLVQLQRTQIAALKALGYSNRSIGLHYFGLATVIVVIGASLGVGLGAWLGDGFVSLYEEFFRFPDLQSRIDPRTALTAVLVSTLAGVAGTLTSVRGILALPPAEAMRPPAPERYRRGVLDMRWLQRLIGPSARMVLREIQRRPLRVLFSATGIAVAVGILVVARFWGDAINYMMDVQMHESQRWDVQVGFAEPRPRTALRTFGHLPGVSRVDGLRTVPVRFRNGARSRTSALIGYADSPSLQRVLEEDRAVAIPDEGVLLTRYLGELLDVGPGDTLRAEVLEGNRRTIELPVAGLVDEPFGLQGHMQSRTLHRALGEEDSMSSALLRVDPEFAEALDQELARLPDVVSVAHKDRIITQFREQSGRNIGVFSLIMTLFAATIAIGVVYNNARVSLSARSRDLASLRVLGFTRAEIAGVLLGELAVQVFLALPIGLIFGRALAVAMATSAADPEQFRFPVLISSQTYAFATLITLASAVFSAWLVRRRVYGLDLIGVLKTRE
ncbi:MAG: ABC transporter permease [Myxococcota bacterium]